MSIEILHPDYMITVGCAYFADRMVAEDGAVTYAATVGVESIKGIGEVSQKAESTIYASGLTYDYTSQKTGAQITVESVQLPKDLVDKYRGQEKNGGFSFESSDDKLPEFAFGRWTEYSDGKKEMVWYPRCKMITADTTDATATDSPTDPSRNYTIVAMPYNRLIRVKYDQSLVDKTKNPFTPEEFFADVVDSKEHALIGTETPASP